MATGTLQRPNDQDERDVAQRQFDDRVNKQSGTSTSPQDTRRASLRDQEASGGTTPNSKRKVGAQEETPFTYKDAYKMYREGGGEARVFGGRGWLLGFGAAGGIVSIVLGLMSLLPLKLPALSGIATNAAGEVAEHIIEHEAEKIFLTFLLRGSNAAVANGNVIVTGNPVGDLFANMRASRFEDSLFADYGLKIEPNGKGGVAIIHNGKSLGDFKKLDELQGFLNRKDLSYDESRRALRLIVRDRIPVWRLVKRFKFADYLRLRYIPFFGLTQKKSDETTAEFQERVHNLQVENITLEQVETLGDVLDCLSEGCDDIDEHLANEAKARQGLINTQELTEGISAVAKEAGEEIARERVEKGLESAAENVATRASTKMASLVAAGTATAGALWVLDLLNMAANLDHMAYDQIDNGKFIDTIGGLRAGAAVPFYAFFAGAADQNKAGDGDVPAEVYGALGDQFNHASETAAWNAINDGSAQGTNIDQWKLPNRAAGNAEWVSALDNAYTEQPLVNVHIILSGWYYSGGIVWNWVGDRISEGFAWAINNFPCVSIPFVIECPKDAIAKLTAIIGPLWQHFTDFVGLSIDALESGLHAFSYLAFGAQEAMNQLCLLMDCYEIPKSAHTEMKQAIAAEKAEYNRGLSIADRFFSADNPESLVNRIAAIMPTASPSKGYGSLAFAGVRLATSTPANLSTVFSGRAMAVDGGVTLTDLMGDNYIGVTEADLQQDIAPELISGGECEVNNDNQYKNCAAGKIVIDAMNCDISVVSLCPGAGPPEGDTSSEAPTYSLPDANARELARLILINPNIQIYTKDNGARHDLEATRDGGIITDCSYKDKNGNRIYRKLDTRLLQTLLSMAGNYEDPRTKEKIPSRYRFTINYLITLHGCDGGYHPQGKAADLGGINGVYAGPVQLNGNCLPSCGMRTTLYKNFATEIGKLLPPGGEIGQTQGACLGHLDIPSNIRQVPDACHHLHVAVP